MSRKHKNQHKRHKSDSNKCRYCHRVFQQYPFHCNYCGGYFCGDHNLPESHNCTGLVRGKSKWFNKKMSKGRKTSTRSTKQRANFYVPIKTNKIKRYYRKIKPLLRYLLYLIILLGAWHLYTNSSAPELVNEGYQTLTAINYSELTQETIKDLSNEPPELNITEMEARVHQLINVERMKGGLQPLKYDDRLALISRKHSQEMSVTGVFSHSNSWNMSPTERGNAAGYYCRKDYGSYYTEGIAENIHQGNTYSSTTYSGYSYDESSATYDWLTAEEIAVISVKNWIGSPGHRENILTASYSHEGIGIAISDDGKVYVTQDFC